jgi:hypothetical protein
MAGRGHIEYEPTPTDIRREKVRLRREHLAKKRAQKSARVVYQPSIREYPATVFCLESREWTT